jgi:RimJ/RimL family protein N-acetyltransferase
MSENTADRPAVIQTRRLRLTELAAADADLLVRLHSDARVEALTMDRDFPMHEPDMAARCIESVQKFYRIREGLGLWRCDLRTDEAAQPAGGGLTSGSPWQFGGTFSLMPLDHPDDPVEIGCRLLPHCWGMGVAVEGGHALLRHGFQRVKLDEVTACCHTENRSVKFALLSLGFQALGRTSFRGIAADSFSVNRLQWQQMTRLPARLRGRMAMMATRALRDPAQAAPAREPTREPVREPAPEPALEPALQASRPVRI